MAIPIIAAVAGAAAVGGTVYNTVESSKARDKAEKAAMDAKQQQDQQLQLAEDQIKQDQKQFEEANTKRDLAQIRQNKISKRGQSAQDTILTGPLGIPNTPGNTPNAANKTILGQ
jgi:hypothetical protein